MTREQVKIMLNNAEVIKAWAQGAAIQYRPIQSVCWFDYNNPYGTFAIYNHEYRVKPEPPKPREYWLKIPPSGDLSYTGIYLCEQDPTHYEPGCKFVHVREVLKDQ